jgi:hypothetical protein
MIGVRPYSSHENVDPSNCLAEFLPSSAAIDHIVPTTDLNPQCFHPGCEVVCLVIYFHFGKLSAGSRPALLPHCAPFAGMAGSCVSRTNATTYLQILNDTSVDTTLLAIGHADCPAILFHHCTNCSLTPAPSVLLNPPRIPPTVIAPALCSAPKVRGTATRPI